MCVNCAEKGKNRLVRTKQTIQQIFMNAAVPFRRQRFNAT